MLQDHRPDCRDPSALHHQVHGDKDADGFYRGECGGRLGYVPCNMVSEIQVDDEETRQQLLLQGFLSTAAASMEKIGRFRPANQQLAHTEASNACLKSERLLNADCLTIMWSPLIHVQVASEVTATAAVEQIGSKELNAEQVHTAKHKLLCRRRRRLVASLAASASGWLLVCVSAQVQTHTKSQSLCFFLR